MRSAAICMCILGFSGVVAAAPARAQDGFDAPIATAPPEVFEPAPASVAAPARATAAAAIAPVDLSKPRESVTAETVASVVAPEAQALATAELADAQAEAEAEQTRAAERKVVELTGDASMSASALAVGEAGGGLLRSNPALQRPGRKPLGLKFKF